MNNNKDYCTCNSNSGNGLSSVRRCIFKRV